MAAAEKWYTLAEFTDEEAIRNFAGCQAHVWEQVTVELGAQG